MTSEMLEKLYFAKCSFRQNLLAKNIRDLLDSNAILALGILGGTLRLFST